MNHDLPLTRRTVISSALLGPAALLYGAVPARAAGAPPALPAPPLTLTLPAPSGRHPVGSRAVHLVDVSRPDPWSAEPPLRELMLTVRYPARAAAGAAAVRSAAVREPQLTAGAAEVFGAYAPWGPLRLPATGVDWAATLTHSHPDAPALPGRWPVLLHSPGGGDPRGLGSTLAEELASHGAVVLSVDHPGDAAAVEFPDRPGPGRVREGVLHEDPRGNPALARTMIATRIADLRFVLDRLHHPGGIPLPPRLAASLDLGRIGVYGHSAGGGAVTELLHEDHRIRTGVNLEGHLDHPPSAPGTAAEPYRVVQEGTARPLLMLASEAFDHRADLDASWSALTRRSGPRVRTLRLPGTGHWSFTDYAAMLPRLQEAGLMPAATRASLIGTLPARDSVAVVRHLVRRFLTTHLAT
ncbi:alpha/beta hydrolase [Kitasatospora sp. NPDC051853]|uniref:alpha/beta hydrolase n=1 Tax=Kitasatospora sp. NPDC051853 TaxID=3364058 RepID=UPI00379DC1B1